MKKIVVKKIAIATCFFVLFIGAVGIACFISFSKNDAVMVMPFSGLDIKQIVCFNPGTGAVLWARNPEEIYPAMIKEGTVIIGFGFFREGQKAIMVMQYQGQRNVLNCYKACGVSHCTCCEVKKYLKEDTQIAKLLYSFLMSS